MQHTPRFSVIVTTHHRPALLERALRSLLAQTFSDFEIVLVADEGSTGTKTAATGLLRAHDVFVVLPGAKGPAQSRNVGVQLARGRYVLFLDDDDSFQPGFLQQVADSGRLVADAVNYVNFTELTERRDEQGIQTLSSREVDISTTEIAVLLIRNFIPNNAIILSADIARRHPIDINLPSHEDWDYLISLVFSRSFNFLGIAGPVVHANEGASRNNDSKHNGSIAVDYLSIYRKWPYDHPDITQARQATLRSMGLDLPAQLL